MKIKSLEIELQTYGDNKGKYQAKVKYTDPTGETELFLSPDVAFDLLKFTLPLLNKHALNLLSDFQAAIASEAKSQEQIAPSAQP